MFEGTKQFNKTISLLPVVVTSIILSLLGCGGSDSDNGSTSFYSYKDPRSSLEWAAFRDPSYSQYYAYDDIISFCDDLNANGKSDWRMPSADETIDYLVNNTDLYESDYGYTSAVSKHSVGFVNQLNPPQTGTYSTGGLPPNIAFKEVPVIQHYDYGNNTRRFGQVMIQMIDPNDPYFREEHTKIYPADATAALKVVYEASIYEDWSDQVEGFACVRGDHSLSNMPSGTWINVENEAEITGTGQFVYSFAPVDNRHIRLTTVMYQEGYTNADGKYIDPGLVIDRNAHYISSGIPDVRVKGQIKSFAEASSVRGIAGIDIILGCLTNKEPQYCQQLIIKPATPDNPHNTYEEASEDGESNILYVTQDAEGNYILDNDNPITIASGKITISLTDSAGSTAVFSVEIAGEDTDVGVLNIPDLQTLYNFKTSIDHGMDYIYHGYNVGETQVAYSKPLSICNVGSASISGTTFTIEVDPDNASVVRSFSHTYDGSSLGFSAGSCENYTVNFEFYRPVEDTEVKFNITITDHFNGLTWYDYTTFRLSQHEPVNVYFASNTQPLEGFLVAPGNQLVRVQFSEYQENLLRVPTYRDSEYHVVLYASSVDGEDTYMITTTDPPVRSRMDGFTDVYAYEPNDDSLNATVIPLQLGEVISYLHSGDMDFFTLKSAP